MKILITGATSGIGYLTALTFAQMNHFVYLTCKTSNQAKNIKKKVESYKNIEVLKTDITNDEDIKKVKKLNVDILICNAALAYGGSIIEADINKLRENFEVNVFSNFNLVKEVLKQMIKRNKGRVVMISSLIVHMPIPFAGIYSSTKASITNLTYALKKELLLANSNVKIALVEPGLYHTGFNQVFLDNKYDNGIYFRNIRNTLYNIEHFIFKNLEKKELDTIVVKIVRASLDKKIKKVYRAPLSHVILSKIYGIIK